MPIQEANPAVTKSKNPRSRAWFAAVGSSAALAVALFVFYVTVYRVGGYRLPVGFDASWYVWRAQYVGAVGIGPLGTSQRPGSEVLAALLHGTSGVSQLRLAVILPLALVAAFALTVGALARSGLGTGSLRWWVSIAVAGTFIGTTRLVGENVAALITVALVTASFVPLIRRVSGHRGFWGVVAFLVAAGVAHWLFLAVFAVVLLVATALALPSSLRANAAGTPLERTEAGTIVGTLGVAGAAMLAIVTGVLRAPFNTIQAKEDPSRYAQKLTSDVRRLYLPWTAPVAAFGAASLALPDADPRTVGRRTALRLLTAWSLVALAGTAYGIVTKNLPPHRFLELFLVVPVALLLAQAVVFAASWVGRRSDRLVSWAVAAAAVVAISVPGASAWYRHGPGEWIQAGALRQADAAARYMETLPHGTPVIFLVSPAGAAGVLSAALKERTIRISIPPELQSQMYVFVGQPADLLAGKRSFTGNPAQNQATLPYWNAVRGVLPRTPPVLILESLAPKQFEQAIASGISRASPGVAVLRGPVGSAIPQAGLEAPALPLRDVVAWGVIILAMLFVAGGGWTLLMFDTGIDPWVASAIAPIAGIAALMLAGLAAAEAGVRLGGPGGAVVYTVTAIAGGVLAFLDRRRRRAQTPSASPVQQRSLTP